MCKQKIYLDYQIFDFCSKDDKLKALLRKQNEFDYYCSTAHVEELHRARSNAKTEKNTQQAQNVQTVIELLCVKGILNPSIDNGIILKDEPFTECYKRVANFDTTATISEVAQEVKECHNQSPSLSHDYHSKTNEKWTAIWDERCVTDRINELNSCDLNKCNLSDLYNRLSNEYGSQEALLEIADYNKSAYSTTIAFSCFNEIKAPYSKLEYVIEQLARLLDRVGYNREGNLKKYNSAEYDISHMIYGTYCDFFVTADNRLYEKAKAIYYYLQVPTTVLHFEDFKRSLV